MVKKNKELTVREFRFSTRLLRSLAERLAGKITNATWTNWRKWANVKANSQSVGGEKALRLLSIAYLRSQHPRKELSSNEIRDTYPVVSPLLEEVVEFLTLHKIPGSMAVEWLEKTQGLRISESTLRRRLAAFGRQKLIPVKHLETIAKSG